jgi:hypothetical protein
MQQDHVMMCSISLTSTHLCSKAIEVWTLEYVIKLEKYSDRDGMHHVKIISDQIRSSLRGICKMMLNGRRSTRQAPEAIKG